MTQAKSPLVQMLALPIQCQASIQTNDDLFLLDLWAQI